jgi:hypothetical protein
LKRNFRPHSGSGSLRRTGNFGDKKGYFRIGKRLQDVQGNQYKSSIIKTLYALEK